MNLYLQSDHFKLSAETILRSSDALDPRQCKIINNVLYESVPMFPNGRTYRFYFDVDVYDYVNHEEVRLKLDKIFRDYEGISPISIGRWQGSEDQLQVLPRTENMVKGPLMLVETSYPGLDGIGPDVTYEEILDGSK